MLSSSIIGSGSFIPKKIIKNEDFLSYDFFDEAGNRIEKSNTEIIQKFKEITEIEQRRYLDENQLNSDMAAAAAKIAIEDAGIQADSLDYIIAAHNFGDVDAGHREIDLMPSISAKVKHKLGINNPHTRPYDMIFGCPGWVEGLILAHHLMQAKAAKRILVLGSDTLSRNVDPHDRTAMIFADGAGAVVLEAQETPSAQGILAYETIADCGDEQCYLTNDVSLNPEYVGSNVNIRMKGRKVYEYALTKVPAVIKRVIDNAGLQITDISKVLIHQANAKMDHAMVQRLFKLYGITEYDENAIAPMTVQFLGNTSVATVPTMYDLINKRQLGNHEFRSGDHIIFAAVGAGMNVNAVIYKIPEVN